MLHWGSQGIRRNLQEAAEYYRLGAQGNDPVANYDYGIVLLRVRHLLFGHSRSKIHKEREREKTK